MADYQFNVKIGTRVLILGIFVKFLVIMHMRNN